MKNYFIYLLLLPFIACNQNGSTAIAPADTTILITNDTIPELRSTVKPEPVAVYSEMVPDSLNDWKLAVSMYETKKTFRFRLKLQYKELRVTDSITVPNFGTEPRVAIHKGKEPLSCILGFLDKKAEFKEQKLVRVINDQLQVRTINTYFTGAYRTKISK